MIVENDVNSIQRGGIAGERVFGFAFNKKMYDLMSTNLYSDRIGSTVRETCSNAWDAHTAAGKTDVPFQVTLPTNLEPHFIVEDFGTGMPDDTAQNLYSTLGLSTKEQSNDMIGAFGLGSKVPFTVTDSFSVENTYNGVTYFYLCFKNEQGFPSILKTGEVPTDRGNGVKVVIPVAGAKYNLFIDAMKRQLIMMEPKPIITNSGAFEFKEPKRANELPGGFIIENAWDFNLNPRQVYAKMGIVLYPIDMDQIGVDRYSRYHEKFSSSSATVLKFNIGDLDPVPSREGLTYDTNGKTPGNIRKAYLQYKEELIDVLTKKILAETHTYTAWQLAIVSSAGIGIDFTQRKIKVNGYTIGARIQEYPSFQYVEDIPAVIAADGKTVQYPARQIKRTVTTYQYDEKNTSSWRRASSTWSRDEALNYLEFPAIQDLVNGTTIYVLMDELDPKRRTVRVAHFLEENPGKNVRFIHHNIHYTGDPIDYTAFKKIYDDFYPGLSNKFVLFSKIAAPVKPKVKLDATTFKGVTIRSPYHSVKDLALDTVLDEDSMFYISAERNTLTKYPEIEMKVFQNLVNDCDYNAIIVRKGGVKSIAVLEDAGILEFSDFVANKLSGHRFKNDFKKRQEAANIYEEYIESNRITEGTWKSFDKLSHLMTPVIKKFVGLLNEAKRLGSNHYAMDEHEKLAEFLRDKGFVQEHFKDADWVKELVSTFKQNFIQARKEYLEAYPLYEIVTHAVRWPYSDFSTAEQYLVDMNELAEFRSKVVVAPQTAVVVEEDSVCISDVVTNELEELV